MLIAWHVWHGAVVSHDGLRAMHVTILMPDVPRSTHPTI